MQSLDHHCYCYWDEDAEDEDFECDGVLQDKMIEHLFERYGIGEKRETRDELDLERQTVHLI